MLFLKKTRKIASSTPFYPELLEALGAHKYDEEVLTFRCLFPICNNARGASPPMIMCTHRFKLFKCTADIYVGFLLSILTFNIDAKIDVPILTSSFQSKSLPIYYVDNSTQSHSDLVGVIVTYAYLLLPKFARGKLGR